MAKDKDEAEEKPTEKPTKSVEAGVQGTEVAVTVEIEDGSAKLKVGDKVRLRPDQVERLKAAGAL